MDRELNPRPSATSVSCNNSRCQFFGSSATEGFCSQCYQKELQRRKQSISEAADVKILKPDIKKTEDVDVFSSDVPVVMKPEIIKTNQTSSAPKKPKKAKCGVCKKKLGLTGFECRCGKLFCATHRYSDKHDCGFDYEKLGKDELRKANPVVENSKIDKF